MGNYNYSDKDNWLAFPTELRHEADAIYFYPTAYLPADPDMPLVCDISDAGMRAGARGYFRRQATAFETIADIYAPFYEQINFSAFGGDLDKMHETERRASRASLFPALDLYFSNYNKGRPYFLVGHSQGSSMIRHVLDEYMVAYPERYSNMVAAYAIGSGITVEWLASNPHVGFAQSAEDTGVVISWNTEGPGNAGQKNLVVPEGAVAINPLNWRRDGAPANVEHNLGSLLPDGGGGWSLSEGIADAQVDVGRGSVICDSVDSAKYAMPPVAAAFFGPESYHGWDYEFYYANIRENAALRLARFLGRSLSQWAVH